MPLQRVLVTGCWGFVGKAATKSLIEDGVDVWGADSHGAPGRFPGKGCVQIDLSRPAEVEKLIAWIQPTHVLHLAAQSSAGRSFKEPLDTIRNNLLATLAVLDAIRKGESRARLLAVGSTDEYGPVDDAHLPLAEARPAQPANPYALSKAVQTQCCSLYHAVYGVDVVMTRSFNHTGPGQTDTFVLPSFARQIAEIKHKVREPAMEVGNIEIKRDFLDVRDVVRAYRALLEKGKPGEIYNVCSGTSYSLKELLHRMCALAGVRVDVRVREERIRPLDARELRGNKLKITRDTGWSPAIPIEETLQSLLDYWERVVVGSGTTHTA
ncbi:MAG: GDP-mannose 4,6-dehydratase [Chitinivibrionia bacterium]|nr:GDP-mannose 4,6-dehydratase [Chitinivibrionia bacterium]